MKSVRAVVIPLLLAASACAPSGGTSKSEPINDATANEAGSAMASSIEDGASGYRRPPDEPSPAMVGTTSGDGEFLPAFCLTLRAGDDWTDVDLDGFPFPEVHVDISCTFLAEGGEYTASGVYMLSDTNPSSAGFDSASAFEDLVVVVVGSTGTFHIAVSGTDVNSAQPTGPDSLALAHHEDQHTESTALGLDGTLYERTEEDYVWEMVLLATGFEPGSDAPAGALELSGAWEVAVENPSEDVHQRSHTDIATLTPLGLDPACETNIVSGAVRASFSDDGATASVDVTWTGCREHTVGYNAPVSD